MISPEQQAEVSIGQELEESIEDLPADAMMLKRLREGR